ncbi:hypothetical protein GOARA_056_01410 [Gordonia araii NBRC 100433]|uniref:VWFA domain-containing protein n=1 Tax=Gordonia araii NBRC 100433 TaxID=1073574 RepID=G7H3G8_9ACTN|nr:VWA domain-containing protein [Gordonia araii]NNG96511.1 solute-binding protein [Gordonia araii NBRC 100433]GAB10393.1 hypothetical protein GOARA_056_01410 [Gordonia araii NBRC 100433]
MPSHGSTADDDFGFEHKDTSKPGRGGLLWGLAAVLVVLALVGGFVVLRGDSLLCRAKPVTVVADAALAGPLKEIAQTTGRCYEFTVTPVAGPDVPAQVTKGEGAPDLWVADSSSQVRRVAKQIRRQFDNVADSIARSPVVVAGQQVPPLKSWVDVMKLPNLRMGSPIDTTIGDAPIIGALAEVDSGALDQKQLIDAMTVLAVQQNNVRGVKEAEGTRLNIANTTPDVPVMTTEQQFSYFVATHQGSALKAAVPEDGTVMLDYPLVNVAGADRSADAAKAGQALVEAVNSDAGKQALARAFLRDAQGAPLTGEGAAAGVGQVKLLTLKDPAQIDRALRQWQVLAVPIRTLVVEDVSGSMVYRAGSGTRADLLREASIAGLRLFPNNAEVGAWIFSIDRGGPGVDYDERAPIRPLGARTADGRTHRDFLTDEVKRAMSDVGGGTGLYDTTLAAFKKVQSTYNPNFSNSVIIMTDGENEDPNSISLDQLLAEIKRMEDPARPVLILTIGISDSADAKALKAIADATGGTSYTAKTPADIRAVFVNAIAARVEAAGK